MSFKPHNTLWNRSFIGLIIAQFQAAFSDQAIHASGMFYAINQNAMSEENAISLMPILFYAPWAIFSTLAGYLADRYSKRNTLVFWKVFEIGIVFVTFLGFYLGTSHGWELGPYLVLSTVFLMGAQSAFFVPAKYGVMPEMLQPHLLSRGNGVLESLSFLAIILGTVCGGVLAFLFRGQEYWIGAILILLSLSGAACSFLVEKIPAAHPERPFPRNLVKPLVVNLQTLIRSRPLRLAVLGIAFFTFVVAFMRATMYMHGESRIPRWSEFDTSIVVAVVALGIGLGSPLAGQLSGGKVELGLIPIGAIGMILTLLVAAVILNYTAALVVCLIAVGFFTGFYIVPLFTLLQHRAPKESKGDLVASSNFINVFGAFTASILFNGFVLLSAWWVIIQTIHPDEVAQGRLTEIRYKKDRPVNFVLQAEKNIQLRANENTVLEVIRFSQHEIPPGTEVMLTRHKIRGVEIYRLQPPSLPIPPARNKAPLTRYLFLGAAAITVLILFLLSRQLPDLLARSSRWGYLFRKYKILVSGNVPEKGPAILLVKAETKADFLLAYSGSDREITFVTVNPVEGEPEKLPFTKTIPVSSENKSETKSLIQRLLAQEELVGIGAMDFPQLGDLFEEIIQDQAVPFVVVSCNRKTYGAPPIVVAITFGPALVEIKSLEELQNQLAAPEKEELV